MPHGAVAWQLVAWHTLTFVGFLQEKRNPFGRRSSLSVSPSFPSYSESHLLQDLVEAYEGSRAADTGGAVDDDRPHVGGDALAVRPHEPDQCLRRLGNT